MEHFTSDAYKEGHIDHEEFGEVFQQLLNQFHVEESDSKVDCHLHNGLFYKLYKICIPKGDDYILSESCTPPKLQGILVLGS